MKIQVKMQRKSSGQPMLRRRKFVVEVQRTRGGVDAATGEPTRPYRFGAFDIIAVCLQPSTGEWNRFMYTVGNWLRPRASSPNLIEVLQPVALAPNEDWTNDLGTGIEWLRSGTRKSIASF